MAKNDEDKDMDRRGFLHCMAWVGTGAVWTMYGGVLKGVPLGQSRTARAGSADFSSSRSATATSASTSPRTPT